MKIKMNMLSSEQERARWSSRAFRRAQELLDTLPIAEARATWLSEFPEFPVGRGRRTRFTRAAAEDFFDHTCVSVEHRQFDENMNTITKIKNLEADFIDGRISVQDFRNGGRVLGFSEASMDDFIRTWE